METISIIADFCGIAGFIISIFVIKGVRKINSQINSNTQTAFGSKNSQQIENKY